MRRSSRARLKQETHSLRLNGGFPRFRESRKRSKNRSVHSSQTVASSSTRTIKDSQGRQHKREKNLQRRTGGKEEMNENRRDEEGVEFDEEEREEKKEQGKVEVDE